ncbi:MAG: SWIM zinc finger family protein, partial [Bacillota bacterium]
MIHMLMEKLKADAGEAVFEKAASHYKSAAVKSYAYNHQGDNRYQIKAIVKASGAYGVNLNLDCNFNRLKIDHYCTCSAGGSRLCEHATAVVYKFLADDFPKLSPSISKPASLDGIELLKMVAAATLEKSALYYAIGGLDNQAGDFQIAFNGPDRDKTFIYELVKCLGDVNYSPRKRELLFNSLNRFDHLIISYLEHSFTGKDFGLKSISLPKSKENLEMILVLIENGRALSADTSKTLKLGPNLKPRVYLTGTETRLQFTFDLAEFEQAGFLDRDLNYLLANDTLYIIDTSGLEKLPPEITITPEELGRVLFEILPRLSEKVHLESAPEFHSHVLLLRQPEIGLFFDYYPEEVS